MAATLETSVEAKYPVFIITCANFTARVPMNAFNSQFDLELMVMEAGTKMYEAFKGVKNGIELILFPDNKGEVLRIGTSCLCHIEGESVNSSALLFTYVLAGNAGYYADSMKLESLLKQQAEQIGQKLAAENAQKKLNKDAIDNKLFDALREKTFPTKETKTNAPKKVTKTPRKIRKGK